MHLGLSVRFIDMQSTVYIKGSCVRLFYDKLVKAGVIHNEKLVVKTPAMLSDYVPWLYFL